MVPSINQIELVRNLWKKRKYMKKEQKNKSYDNTKKVLLANIGKSNSFNDFFLEDSKSDQ